jgi:hypothetical protein
MDEDLRQHPAMQANSGVSDQTLRERWNRAREEEGRRHGKWREWSDYVREIQAEMKARNMYPFNKKDPSTVVPAHVRYPDSDPFAAVVVQPAPEGNSTVYSSDGRKMGAIEITPTTTIADFKAMMMKLGCE